MKIAHFLILTFLFFPCSATKTVQKTGIDEISFGSGGGFTGAVTTYTLKSDGNLLKNNEKFKQISKKETAKFFIQAKELTEINYSKPGNIYSFITIKTNKITWAFGDKNLDIRALNLYNNLNTLIKQ